MEELKLYELSLEKINQSDTRDLIVTHNGEPYFIISSVGGGYILINTMNNQEVFYNTGLELFQNIVENYDQLSAYMESNSLMLQS